MKSVIIAEKPSVAADIATAIGGFKKIQSWFESDNAIITNGFGHLVECYAPEMELPSSNQLEGLPVLGQQFKLRPRKNASTQLSLLKKLISRDDVSHVVNACDAGREGELIFRLIYAACGSRKPIRRMWYTSMTKDALREAWRKIEDGSKYNALYEAALCRNESDYLVGLNASKGISDCQSILARSRVFIRSGRVQTPVLALIVDRENEINKFIPQSFNEIVGTFVTSKGSYDAVLQLKQEDGETATTRIFDADKLTDLKKDIESGVVESAVDEVKTINNKSPNLFSLSALQKVANQKYRYTADETLKITQKLYETHKMVTYPRTSSDALPEDYLDTVNLILKNTFLSSHYEAFVANAMSSGKLRADNKSIFDNERISDHFAIIPAVGSHADTSKLNSDEIKIYDLIVRRFLAAFYPDAIYDETLRTTYVSTHPFIVKGKVLKQSGWLEVADITKKDSLLCQLDEGKLPNLSALNIKQGKTTPPKRYDDSSLLSAMINAGRLIDDKNLSLAMKSTGLGTEATRASIIEGLLTAKTASGKPVQPYAIRDKSGYFTPTELACQLITFCRSSGLEVLTSPVLTGEWEHKLSLVEKGQVSRNEFMAGIRAQVVKMIELLKTKVDGVNAGSALVFDDAKCPGCNSALNSYVDHVGCQTKCGFRIYKSLFGRSFTDNEIRTIINNRKSDFFDDFKSSKTGKTYSASIVLSAENTPAIEFKPAAVSESSLKCPNCNKALMQSVSGFHALSCSPCNFSLAMIIAKRKMSEAELKTLLETGYLNSRKGFVSSKNKDFAAALSLDKNTGKVTFSFDN